MALVTPEGVATLLQPAGVLGSAVQIVGVDVTAPYVPSLVPPSEFSCFRIFAKFIPYFVVCVPKTFESVAKPDLLYEKSLYGPKVLRVENPFPPSVGTLPLVFVNGNAGKFETMSGELELLRRPITLLGTSPKEYDAPNSITVDAEGTHVARPTCVRPGELD